MVFGAGRGIRDHPKLEAIAHSRTPDDGGTVIRTTAACGGDHYLAPGTLAVSFVPVAVVALVLGQSAPVLLRLSRFHF
jgi:hypothetical protein